MAQIPPERIGARPGHELMFAYGSNLDRHQVDDRCPSNRPLVRASLAGHELCFPSYSHNRRGGVASIKEKEGSVVWGALYDLTLEDLEEMDGIEGPKTNPRRPVAVEVPGVGRVTAWMYQYSGQHEHHEPSEAYLRQILDGCAAWGAPASYIRLVQEIAKGHAR